MLIIVILTLFLLYFGIKLLYNTAKILFVFLDIVVVFFASYFAFLKNVGSKISEAPASYLWSFVIAFLAVSLYLGLIFSLGKFSSKLFLVFQSLVSLVTVFIFWTIILYGNSKYYGNYYIGFCVMPLFKNEVANIIANLVFFCICVGIITQGRYRAFEDIFDQTINTKSKKARTVHSKEQDYSFKYDYSDNSYEDTETAYETNMNNDFEKSFIETFEHYCNILNIDDFTSIDQDLIKENYRQLAKKYHPDINSDKVAKDLFKEINNAKDFLNEQNIQNYLNIKGKNSV